MLRRAQLNYGADSFAVMDRYLRLALKAQAGSRVTIEALAKLHQPREQTVRHVHVNQGGHAVIADEFHNHTGGLENASSEQPHGQGSCLAALPGADLIGNSVPVSGNQGQSAMPNARRKRERRPIGATQTH